MMILYSQDSSNNVFTEDYVFHRAFSIFRLIVQLSLPISTYVRLHIIGLLFLITLNSQTTHSTPSIWLNNKFTVNDFEDR